MSDEKDVSAAKPAKTIRTASLDLGRPLVDVSNVWEVLGAEDEERFLKKYGSAANSK